VLVAASIGSNMLASIGSSAVSIVCEERFVENTSRSSMAYCPM